MIELFTDGGCSGNPGPGAWAFVAVQNNLIKSSCSGADKSTTNNKMELQAVINALVWAQKEASGQELRIITDSRYVQLGITQWMLNWEKNGWKTANKKPVKNLDLWLKLKSLNAELKPQWAWVQGHAGNTYNEACDVMVQEEIRKIR